MTSDNQSQRTDQAWARNTCTIAARWRDGNHSIHQLFQTADPRTEDRTAFVAAVSGELRVRPDLIELWITYSANKRTRRGPYLRLVPEADADGYEVGYFDSERGYSDQTRHTDPAAACADFLYREARFVLNCERVS